MNFIRDNGWQVNGNNIHGLPGLELLSAGPGALEPANWFDSMWHVGAGFVVLRRTHTTNPDGTLTFHHHALARFDTVDELTMWLKVFGKRSEGGLPGFITWD